MSLADEMASKLTDAYEKSNTSNNYKLFSLVMEELKDIKEKEQYARQSTCINTSEGETLELIGKDLGVERNGLTDEVYRITLKAKEYMNFGTGSFNNSVTLLANALNCDISDIVITEGYESEECECSSIQINSLPLEVLNNAGMSIEQYEEIIRYILPAGIRLTSAEVEGTFTIGDNAESTSDVETDDTTGFANDTQTTGGTLGAIIGGTTRYVRFTVAEEGTIRLDIEEENVAGKYVERRTIYVLRSSMPENFDFYLYNGNKMYIYTATLSAGEYTYSLTETYDVLNIEGIEGFSDSVPVTFFAPSYTYDGYDTFWDCPYFGDSKNRIYIKSTQTENFTFGSERESETELSGKIYEDTTAGKAIYAGTSSEVIVAKNNNEWGYTLGDTIDTLYIENTTYLSNYVRINIDSSNVTRYNIDGYSVDTADWNNNYREINIVRKQHTITNTEYEITNLWVGEGATYRLNITVNNTTQAYTFSFEEIEEQQGGLACFTEETLVATSEGLKPICDIKIGDEIHTSEGLRVVNKKYEHITDRIYSILVNGKIIRSSFSHPFVTERGIINAENLVAGDVLYDVNGNRQNIENITFDNSRSIVYEINSDADNYYVTSSQILVKSEKLL